MPLDKSGLININEEEEEMSYEEYKAHAKEKGFQPLGLKAFEAMIMAGFCFKSGRFK